MTSDSEFLLFIPCTFWTNIKHLRWLSGWSTVSCLLHFWPLSRFPSFMLICVLQITSDFLLKLHISKILCENKLSPLCEMLYISFPETKVSHWCLWLDLPAHLRDRGPHRTHTGTAWWVRARVTFGQQKKEHGSNTEGSWEGPLPEGNRPGPNARQHRLQLKLGPAAAMTPLRP